MLTLRMDSSIRFITALTAVLFSISGCSSAQPDPTPPSPTSETIRYHPDAKSEDLVGLALIPEDLSGIFSNTTYGVQQYYDQQDYFGVRVTYPTRVIPHTTAFAEGFYTELLLYDHQVDAQTAFETATSNHTGEKIPVAHVGDQIAAYKGEPLTSEGFELNSRQYSVFLLKGNLLASIVLRSPITISTNQLVDLAEKVNNRIESDDLRDG